MFGNKDLIEISLNREPSWQRDEDLIVGKMIRQLLSFEGRIIDQRTIKEMENVIESSAMMAEQVEARADYVRKIGKNLRLNGKPMGVWKQELPLSRFQPNGGDVPWICPVCGSG